ncbi:hypothetical protein EZV62_016961 [Acer yangbiense]|uniref:F-box associated domain-containing protein n=1 Tax=Acer yangbiense TaxID=1000413 RepID=A0A5C7HSI1_9ROSI|nr:hypothetical protein EZV62_016961 [Acer yangbiense]
MHIFSLRNNSWKIVEGNFPFEQPNIRGGVSLNGALHWGTVSYPNDLGVITRFFKTLPLPDIPNPPQRCECMVRVVGEYLCVAFGTYNEFSGIKAEEGFWIMKEYGVKESWIRIVISHDPFDLIYTEQCTVTAAILNSFPRTPENEPEPAKPSKLELRCCPISP